MRTQIDLLRPAAVFASVVHHGSFRAAAEALDLSAPQASQMISDLEARLGLPLINRASRSLTLTQAGEQFFESTSSMLDIFREGLGVIAPQHLHIAGRLRVSGPATLESAAFARFLRLFKSENANVDLELDLNDSSAGIADDGRYDLSLRFAPMDRPLKHDRLLLEVDFLLVASPELLPLPTSPTQLNQKEWIRPPQLSNDLVIRHTKTGESDQIRPSNHLRVSSTAMMRRLVEEGAGFGVFPDFSVQKALHSGKLVNLMPGWTTGRCGLFSVVPKGHLELSSARAFVEALDRHLKHQTHKAKENLREA